MNLSNINVVFSDRMSSSTINTTNIKLYETGANWAAVSTTVVYNSANKKAILTPSSSLTP
ncbi:MAG: Ig-like domain-containing protein [Patescibacteria group bacterium]